MIPCLKHPESERYASGRCKACQREASRKWEKSRPDLRRAKARRLYMAHREERREKAKAWRVNNREKKRAYGRRERAKHADKYTARLVRWLSVPVNRFRYDAARAAWDKKHPENHKKYNQRYPERTAARAARRRAAMLQAIPSWATEADLREILAIYEKARIISAETGITHHVDHEIPLRGTHVCGLHIPNNLRVVTAEENLKKNRFFAS